MNIGDGLRFEQESNDIPPVLFSLGFSAAGKPTLSVVHNYVAYLNSHFAIATRFSGSRGLESPPGYCQDLFGTYGGGVIAGEDEASCTAAGPGAGFGWVPGVLVESNYIDRILYSHMVVARNGYGLGYDGTLSGDSATFRNGGFLTGALLAPGFPAAGSGSITTLLTGIQSNLVSGSFVGKITGDDPGSAVDSNGTASFADMLQGSDWWGRENFARAWQKDWAVSTPTTANSGACANSGICRLVDWSLRMADSVLLNKTGFGAGASSSNPTPGPGLCPSEIAGSEVIIFDGGCSKEIQVTSGSCVSAGGMWHPPQVFLKNAIELPTVSDGDKDGLCESNETCIYTPNFGAYQGHGELRSCTFNGALSSNTVGGVTMHFYSTNGR